MGTLPPASRVRPDAGGVVAALRRRFQSEGVATQLVETHISWVLLAGEFAYKIKKPVCLGFLDFTSLAARHFFCDEELRLNRRLAAPLYEGVVPVCDAGDGPALEGQGSVIEYALKMRRFPANSLASERLAGGSVGSRDLGRFAQRLAAFHRTAPSAAPEQGFGTPTSIQAAARRTLDSLESLAGSAACTSLRQWLGEEGERLAVPWQERLAGGRVREGHGDLHLDNLVLLDGEWTAFDCIEFDPALRWIDVVSDVAFLVMDLLAHGRRDLAFGFLNDYLDCSGDHGGVAVLRYYLVGRALVRALVTGLRERAGVSGAGLGCAAYLHCARQIAESRDARLAITHGLPGSGKSYVSRQLLERVGAIRARSDVERKRLAAAEGRYAPDVSIRTYDRLAQIAQVSLRAGFPTLVDATFLQHAQRERMREMAYELRVPLSILDCRAPIEVLRERVRRRGAQGGDASEADEAVLERLAVRRDELDEEERALVIDVPTGEHDGAAGWSERWLAAPRPPA